MILFLLVIGFLILVVFVIVYFKDVLPLMFHGAPWQPSEVESIRKMLEMAELKQGEKVYELGSGDGRILIMAAEEFGAQATGIEINPFLVLYSRLRVWAKRLNDKVKIIGADMFKIDISEADVLVLFQREETNERLKEKLSTEMKKGARLVSYVWQMKNWEPEKSDSSLGIYLYKI